MSGRRRIEYGGLTAVIQEEGCYFPTPTGDSRLKTEITVSRGDRDILRAGLEIRSSPRDIDPLTSMPINSRRLAYTLEIDMDKDVEPETIRELLHRAGYIVIALNIPPGEKKTWVAKSIGSGAVEIPKRDRIFPVGHLHGKTIIQIDGREIELEASVSEHGYLCVSRLLAPGEVLARYGVEISAFFERMSSGIYVSLDRDISEDIRIVD